MFEELLTREDNANEELIFKFFNDSTEEEGSSAILFYKITIEEEEEIEVEYGRKYYMILENVFLIFLLSFLAILCK